MMKRSLRIIVCFVLSGFVLMCTDKVSDQYEMSVDELIEAMVNDSLLVILDVRTPGELKGSLGKIDGVINIPIQELEERMDELKEYKNNHIAIICRSGNRSGVATKILIEKGYDVKNVVGGMRAYNKIRGE